MDMVMERMDHVRLSQTLQRKLLTPKRTNSRILLQKSELSRSVAILYAAKYAIWPIRAAVARV